MKQAPFRPLEGYTEFSPDEWLQALAPLGTGPLIAALRHAGLATLTHTPSPMKFLNRIMRRPAEERPFLLLVTGYPAADAKVPDIRRKELEEFSSFTVSAGRGAN
jgi:hypothetical protein